jgi:hypothetical protein
MVASEAMAEPLGVRLTAAFFVLAGALEIGLTLFEVRPLSFWPVWDACVRGGMNVLLAMGLRRRYAICRSIAMIYCLAVVITYLVAVGLALTGAPLRFPTSIVVQSLLHVPSGVVLFLYLRSPIASAHFPRPLFPKRRRPPTPEDRTCSGPPQDL